MIGERQQRIGLRIIGADRAYWDAMRFCPEATDDSPISILSKRFYLDDVTLRDPACLHVGFIHEHHHAAPEHAAIAVVETVDRRIVLIVASEGRKPKHCGIGDRRVFGDPGEEPENFTAPGGGSKPPAA